MSKELDDAWAQASANPNTVVDIGRAVVCDVCNTDFTDSTDSGGFIFGSYGYCPACAAKSEPEIEQLGESHYIRARCPAGMSFADFVRKYRGPEGNKISIRTGLL